jgi:dihydropyrimidinase
VLIRGGTVVDAAGARRADLRTDPYGQIAAVEPELAPTPGEEVVEAAGRLVIPGGVDAHTHLHLDVGAASVSDDFGSGTAAAAVGGTTTVIEYVTTRRGQPPLEAVSTWQGQAEAAAVDYGFHLTLVDHTDEAVIADCIERGITSFKLYMAYPETLQVDDQVIEEVLGAASRHGGLVTIHAENGAAITRLERQALAAGHRQPIEHALTRPPEVEGDATARAAVLAERVEAPIYVVHVSSAPALTAVRTAQERGVTIMAETCPQYLYLDVDRLDGPDAENFVCTPPLRTRDHAEELWHGLGAGWVHTVATDHCPFWMHDRRAGTAGRPDGWADFTEIPGGLPGIETRLALIWDGVRAGHLTVQDWVRLCAEAPARTFGLWPRKGSLAVGTDADVVVWDPTRTQSLSASALHMRTDHSPYAGTSVTGWPSLVLSRGRPVARDGVFCGEPGAGQYLHRGQVWFGD